MEEHEYRLKYKQEHKVEQTRSTRSTHSTMEHTRKTRSGVALWERWRVHSVVASVVLTFTAPLRPR